MMLPTVKQQPKRTLTEFTMLLYGPSKIGKTRFCSSIPNALFIATEQGHNHVEAFVRPVNCWDDFLLVCAELAKKEHPFTSVLIDTTSNLVGMCTDHVLAKYKVSHESDLPYGKGHALVRNEFTRVINKLAMLGLGTVFICHAIEREYETQTGKRIRIVPDLPEKIRQFVVGLCDFVAYANVESSVDSQGHRSVHRVLHTKPSAEYDAGDRTGKLPETLPLDYDSFVKAFEETQKNNH
jgi:hypothetical protein